MKTSAVILATNRQSPYLVEALQSVRNQTVAPNEVIVVLDGPGGAGSEQEVLEVFPAATVVRQPARGVAVARNVGAMVAQSNYLLFLDDDDVWEAGRIEKQVAAVSEAAAVGGICLFSTIDQSGKLVTASTSPPDRFRPSSVRERSPMAGTPVTLVERTAFWAVGGFHSAMTIAEDYDLLLRLQEHGELVLSREVLVRVRSHAGNTSKDYRGSARWTRAVIGLHRLRARDTGDMAAAAELEAAAARHAVHAAWQTSHRWAGGGWRRPRERAEDLAWLMRYDPLVPWKGLRRRLTQGRTQ